MLRTTAVYITIGGALPESQVAPLVAAFERDELDAVCGGWEGDEDSLYRLILPGQRSLSLIRTDAPIGWVAATEAFCIDQELTYVASCRAAAEQEGQLRWWIPGMSCPLSTTANQQGTPTVTAPSLLKALRTDGDPNDAIRCAKALLEGLIPPEVPPLSFYREKAAPSRARVAPLAADQLPTISELASTAVRALKPHENFVFRFFNVDETRARGFSPDVYDDPEAPGWLVEMLKDRGEECIWWFAFAKDALEVLASFPDAICARSMLPVYPRDDQDAWVLSNYSVIRAQPPACRADSLGDLLVAHRAMAQVDVFDEVVARLKQVRESWAVLGRSP